MANRAREPINRNPGQLRIAAGPPSRATLEARKALLRKLAPKVRGRDSWAIEGVTGRKLRSVANSSLF